MCTRRRSHAQVAAAEQPLQGSSPRAGHSRLSAAPRQRKRRQPAPPGGPYRRTPLGGARPRRWKEALWHSGHSTAWRRRRLTSGRPPTSSQLQHARGRGVEGAWVGGSKCTQGRRQGGEGAVACALRLGCATDRSNLNPPLRHGMSATTGSCLQCEGAWQAWSLVPCAQRAGPPHTSCVTHARGGTEQSGSRQLPTTRRLRGRGTEGTVRAHVPWARGKKWLWACSRFRGPIP